MLRCHLITSETDREIATACGIVGLKEVVTSGGFEGRISGGCGRGYVAKRNEHFEPDERACLRCTKRWIS